jgi:hypothetical protein
MRKNPWKISTLVLAGALTFVVGNRVHEAYAEPQPHMKAALELLEKARDQLQKGSTDKGGHRVKAIGLTKDAIEEVKKGIAFDNKN